MLRPELIFGKIDEQESFKLDIELLRTAREEVSRAANRLADFQSLCALTYLPQSEQHRAVELFLQLNETAYQISKLCFDYSGQKFVPFCCASNNANERKKSALSHFDNIADWHRKEEHKAYNRKRGVEKRKQANSEARHGRKTCG